MKYGLVLAGGGTRGAYQIGVMKALRELDIEISAVCGTSIGAINGVLFAQDGIDTAEQLWRKIRLEDIVDIQDKERENLLSVSGISELIKNMRNGGFDVYPLENLLKSLIDEDKIRNSPIDFGLVSISLTNHKTVRLFKEDIPYGKIYEYLIAGASLPVFKVKEIDGERFIDGGMTDNMPVGMLIDKGIKNIIAVDVSGIGIKRDTCNAGVNLIEINCNKPSLGILDFDGEAIEKSISEGYFDTHKTFGSLSGKKYFFDSNEYTRLKRIYSETLLDGIESAAEIFGIERICKYSFEDFVKSTVAAYLKCAALCNESAVTAIRSETEGAAVVSLINMLRDGNSEFLKKKLDFLGKYYNAASALIYFERKLK